jgi:hypothetical protein
MKQYCKLYLTLYANTDFKYCFNTDSSIYFIRIPVFISYGFQYLFHTDSSIFNQVIHIFSSHSMSSTSSFSITSLKHRSSYLLIARTTIYSNFSSIFVLVHFVVFSQYYFTNCTYSFAPHVPC